MVNRSPLSGFELKVGDISVSFKRFMLWGRRPLANVKGCPLLLLNKYQFYIKRLSLYAQKKIITISSAPSSRTESFIVTRWENFFY